MYSETMFSLKILIYIISVCIVKKKTIKTMIGTVILKKLHN